MYVYNIYITDRTELSSPYAVRKVNNSESRRSGVRLRINRLKKTDR